jgi:hypothetical protein
VASFSATMRPTMSVALPGVNAISARIGLAGHSCAGAGAAASPTAAASAMAMLVVFISCSSSSLECDRRVWRE